MLLIELTLPSGLRRVSNEPLALEHFWEPNVASCGPVKLAADSSYGGYVRPQYGKIELTPDAFTGAGDWPPPVSMPIALFLTDTDEVGRQKIMHGTAHRESVLRDSFIYDLYAPDYSGRFTDHVYDNTVTGLFINNIANADAFLTADTSMADANNAPHIDYTDKGDQVVIDSLSKACACAGHLFYIKNSVAYLVDMLTNNGSREITEFDFFPSDYRDDVPYATFRSGDISVDGTYAYGKDMSVSPVFSADNNEINKGLLRIKQIMEAPRVTLKMPITVNVPKFGERLSWVDASRGQDITAWIRVRAISFDFDNDQIVVEGEGGIS